MIEKIVWTITGNGGYALMQALAMILVNHYLGLEALGVFSLAMAVTAPIMLFSNLGLRNLWVTDVASRYSFDIFVAIRRITSSIAVLICMVVGFVYDAVEGFYLVVLLVALSKFVENDADVYYAFWNKENNQKKLALSVLFRGVFGCFGIWIGVKFFGDVYAALTLYLIAWIIVHYIYDLRSIPVVRITMRDVLQEAPELILKGLPLGVALFLINMILNLPRFALERTDGLQAVGVFSALYFFVQAGSIAINSVGQAMLPKLSRHYAYDEKMDHLKISILMVGVALSFSILAAVFFYFLGGLLLELLYGRDMAVYSSVLVYMFLLSPLQYGVSLMGHIVSSAGKNVDIMKINLVGLLIGFVSVVPLITHYGMMGAVYAMAIISLVSLMYFCYVYYRRVYLA